MLSSIIIISRGYWCYCFEYYTCCLFIYVYMFNIHNAPHPIHPNQSPKPLVTGFGGGGGLGACGELRRPPPFAVADPRIIWEKGGGDVWSMVCHVSDMVW